MPSPGDVVGSFRFLFALGQGGMASVFAAQRTDGPKKGERVACKMLLPHLRGDARWRAQFQAEAQTAACVAHPNVVRVIDEPQDFDAGHFAMEWLEGASLDRVMAVAGRLPAALACSVLAQAAEGLHAAHRATDPQGNPLRIVHRDISPHNIHLGRNGWVKLLDFGIAAAQGLPRLTRTGELKGKLAYLSPEQITRAHDVDLRSDLWALGVVAYELFVGGPLFGATDEATTLWNVTALDVPPLGTVCPALPAKVAAVIDSCLSRDPHQRPASAGVLADVFSAHAAAQPVAALRAFMDTLPIEPVATLAMERPQKPRRSKLALGLALVTVSVISVGVLFFAGSAPPKPLRPAVSTAPVNKAPAASLTVPLEIAPAAKPQSKRRATKLRGTTHPDLVSNPY